MSARTTRTAAEWVTLVASTVLVLAVVTLVAVQIPNDEPAAPAAEIEAIRPVGSSFHVDVEVHNDGDRTAASVQVTAELMIGERSFTGDQVVDFLSGGEVSRLSFVFDEDPSAGELVVSIAGYAEP